MMFRHILDFLAAPGPQARAPDLRVAVAVLLVEAARRDDTFGLEERGAITRLLTQRFSLSSDECAALLAAAEKTNAQATQLHPYLRIVFEQMSPPERIQLIEMLWEVAYADGILDPEEDALIRRLGGLIYVTDRDRVLARQRVLARLHPQSAG